MILMSDLQIEVLLHENKIAKLIVNKVLCFFSLVSPNQNRSGKQKIKVLHIFFVQVRNNPAALLALCWYWASDGVGSKVLYALYYTSKLRHISVLVFYG